MGHNGRISMYVETDLSLCFSRSLSRRFHWQLARKETTAVERREKKSDRGMGWSYDDPVCPSSLNLSTQRNENWTVEVIKRVRQYSKIRYQDNEIISPALLSGLNFSLDERHVRTISRSFIDYSCRGTSSARD